MKLSCRLGLHRYRIVAKRNRRLYLSRAVAYFESQRWGEFEPYAKRCRYCGKQINESRIDSGSEFIRINA